MRQPTIHLNPDATKNLTACGRVASKVIWRKSRQAGVTCKSCLKAMAKETA